MKSILFIGFLFVFFGSSCNKKRTTVQSANITRITVDDFVDKEIDLQKVIKKIETIDLSEDGTFLLAHLKDVTRMDSLLFLLDDVSATIWTINMNNKKIVNRACRKGNGPQEFIHPIAMSAWNGRLYVLDMPMRKVVVLDSNMSPLYDFILPFTALDLAATSSGLLFYNMTPSEEYGSIVQTDFQGTGRTNLYQAKKELGLSTSGQKTFVKEAGGNVYAMFPEEYDIFIWKNESFNPLYHINYMEASLPDDYDRKRHSVMEEDDYAIHTNLFVLPEMLVNSFLYKEKRYYTFTSKNGEKQISGVVRDKETDLPFYPQWQADNCLIGWCSGEDAIKYLSKEKGLHTVSEDSDMLLLFYPALHWKMWKR